MYSDSDSDNELFVVKSGGGKLPISKYFLAFGDSLTEGYYHMGFQFHPYTEKLEELFSRENLAIGIVNRGISGDTTTNMIRRLEVILQKSIQFDYVCILAGTNDLAGMSETSDSIFGRLHHLYQLILQHPHRSTLVVVTIPPTSFDKQEAQYLEKKTRINDKIKAFAEEHRESGRVVLVDLFAATPYYLENGEKSPLWDDHLHFGPTGYDYFGELIFNAIRSQLPAPSTISDK